MRSRRDPIWRKHYYENADRAHRQYNEGRISIRELRRKIEAGRRLAISLTGGNIATRTDTN